MKKSLLLIILFSLGISQLIAQHSKRISMQPITYETDSVTPVLADVLNDSVGVAARFLPGCTFVDYSGGINPITIATENDLDFLISGRVVKHNGYKLELSVYDHSLGTEQTETVSINRSLEIFEVIDELTEPVLNAVTGTELSYGALEFINIGWPEALCRMTINAVNVGTNLERISRLPVGLYMIKVEQLTIDGPVTVMQLDVAINKNQMSTISYFTIEAEPPEIIQEPIYIDQNHTVLQSGHLSFLTEFEGHYYYAYTNDGYTWVEAKSVCEELGGYLVSITSQAEQNAITRSLRRASVQGLVYIGLYMNSGGQWVWTSGEDLKYTRWAFGPNDTSNFASIVGIMRGDNYWQTYFSQWVKNDINSKGFILETEGPLELPE